MNGMAGHPIASYLFNNHTVAASKGGTAAATALISSVDVVHARFMRVHNMGPVPVELVFGAEEGTAAVGIFVPGRENATALGTYPTEIPIALDQGMAIRARTVHTVAATYAEITPLHISLWD